MTTATTATEPEGLLLVDKPAGRTSHDVVDLARRALGTRRVGHAGTLDPFATGLLVLMVGKCTRLAPYLDNEPKVYAATVAFGRETSSDDATGATTREAAPPTEAAVRAALPGLTGRLSQLPPAVSAKQVGGVRAHAAARKGAPLELAPVEVTVHAWEQVRLTGDLLSATITCGGGTYIRALARDLGRATASAAHCATLRRLRAGTFDVAHAVPAEDLRAHGRAALRDPLSALRPDIARVALTDDDVRAVSHGRAVGTATAATQAALVTPAGRLMAMAEARGGAWQPTVVLHDA